MRRKKYFIYLFHWCVLILLKPTKWSVQFKSKAGLRLLTSGINSFESISQIVKSPFSVCTMISHAQWRVVEDGRQVLVYNSDQSGTDALWQQVFPVSGVAPVSSPECEPSSFCSVLHSCCSVIPHQSSSLDAAKTLMTQLSGSAAFPLHENQPFIYI